MKGPKLRKHIHAMMALILIGLAAPGLAISSCNCVAFRLSNIQDYYMTSQQLAIMNLFHQYQVPLTLGIAGNYVGVDSKLVTSIKNATSDATWPTEFACNGYNYVDYTTMDASNQTADMLQCSQAIKNVFNKTPKSFIPPFDKMNDDTISAAQSAGFTHVSASTANDVGPYPTNNTAVFRFPAGSYTHNITQEYAGTSAAFTWSQIQAQINATGFSVVEVQPYEYAPYSNGYYNEKTVLQTQLDQLLQLFWYVRSTGKRIVLLSEVNNYFDVPYYPKCVAFRLDDIQDYYCDDQQIAIMQVFEQMQTPMTIGVIAHQFGADSTILNAVKQFMKTPGAEVCDHGYDHEDFSAISLSKQESLLSQSVNLIQSTLGVRVTTFIPPFNSWNANTITALKASGFNLMSSEVDQDPPPYNSRTKPPSDGFWRFPIQAQTAVEVPNGNYAPIAGSVTMSQIDKQVATYGYSAVMMHPFEFAGQDKDNNPIENVVNQTQIEELRKVVFQAGLKYKLVNLHDLQFC